MKFPLDKLNATELSKPPPLPLPYLASLCPGPLFKSKETDSVQRFQTKTQTLFSFFLSFFFFFFSLVKLERREQRGSYANKSREALNFLDTPTHAFFHLNESNRKTL